MTIIIRDAEPSWSESVTLEQALLNAIQAGEEHKLVSLLSLLPDEKKAVYRELWRLRAKGNGISAD